MAQQKNVDWGKVEKQMVSFSNYKSPCQNKIGRITVTRVTILGPWATLIGSLIGAASSLTP